MRKASSITSPYSSTTTEPAPALAQASQTYHGQWQYNFSNTWLKGACLLAAVDDAGGTAGIKLDYPQHRWQAIHLKGLVHEPFRHLQPAPPSNPTPPPSELNPKQ